MTILFQAKFLALVILFSKISSLIKSETPSHCSELYGCQSEDSQAKIVDENYETQKKYLDARINLCKQGFEEGRTLYSSKYNEYFVPTVNCPNVTTFNSYWCNYI